MKTSRTEIRRVLVVDDDLEAAAAMATLVVHPLRRRCNGSYAPSLRGWDFVVPPIGSDSQPPVRIRTLPRACPVASFSSAERVWSSGNIASVMICS